MEFNVKVIWRTCNNFRHRVTAIIPRVMTHKHGIIRTGRVPARTNNGLLRCTTVRNALSCLMVITLVRILTVKYKKCSPTNIWLQKLVHHVLSGQQNLMPCLLARLECHLQDHNSVIVTSQSIVVHLSSETQHTHTHTHTNLCHTHQQN